jgi:imidazole glycerol-phosphate synthase subunit HisH
MQTVVVDTGAANTASVGAALRRAGVTSRLVSAPDAIQTADKVLLPGVGAFGVAMARLERTGMAEALRERISRDRPLMTICLGLQLLCRRSEESPGVPGLGAIEGSVTAFSEDLIVPQMGWNRVSPGKGSLVRPGWAYFANSYKLDALPSDWIRATSVHGRPYVAAAERGALLACQFHPELSGDWGQALLERWLC